MSVPIMRSKLSPPLQAVALLDRPRLLERLGGFTGRLSILTAPAGFGKTTLLAQCYDSLANDGRVCAWLTVDDDDDDPTRFFAHLIATIALAHPDFCDLPGDTLQNATDFALKPLLWKLIEALEAGAPLTLVLDDIHRIRNPAILDLLQLLIDRGPAPLRLILAGRTRPALRTGALKAQGLMIEIDLEALRFTAEEARCYFGPHAPAADIHALLDRTEGWAVALQLSRLWLKERGELPDPDVSPTSLGLAQYLVEEILASLPPREQYFLMTTSILEAANADLATLLSGEADGWALLERFAQDNLLVTSPGSDIWYRYHNVFAGFLRERLERLHRPIIADLHRKAAGWFFEQGMPHEAVRHAQRAGDPAYAAELVDRLGGWRLALTGGFTMLRMLGNIDLKVMERFPRARLGQIYLTAQDGHIAAARAGFEQLRRATRDFRIGDGDDWDRGLFVESRAIEQILSIYEDRPILMEHLDQLRPLVEEADGIDDAVRGLMGNFLCYGYFDAGDYARCRAQGYQVLSGMGGYRSPYAEHYLYAYMGMACLRQGRTQEAAALLRTMRGKALAMFGADSNQVAIADLLLAEVHLNLADLDAARGMIERALISVEQVDGWFDVYASGYLTTAILAERTEGAEAALAILERARTTASRRGLTRLGDLADIQTARVLARDDRPDEASRLLARRSLAYCLTLDPGHTARDLFLVSRGIAAIARIDLARGDTGNALARLTPLRERLGESGLAGLAINVLLLEAIASARAGQLDQAALLADSLLTESSRTGLRIPLLCEPDLLAELAECLGSRLGDRHRPHLLALLPQGPASATGNAAKTLLSRREVDVAEALADGLSNKEIARRLTLAEGTVKIHRKNIYRKLNVSSRASVVAYLRALEVTATPAA